MLADSCGPQSNWKEGLRGESGGAVTCNTVQGRACFGTPVAFNGLLRIWKVL